MRVTVDATLCEAHGDCAIHAPGLFRLDDDADVSTVLVPEPDPSQHAAARRAADGCPAQAIRIEE